MENAANFITSSEAATLLNVSARRIQVLCKEGRIVGAKQFGRAWMIPININGAIEVTPGSRGPSIISSLVTIRNNE